MLAELGSGAVFLFFPSYSAESVASSSAPCLGYLWGSVSPTSPPVALCGVALRLQAPLSRREASCPAASPFVKQGRAAQSWEAALCPRGPPPSPPSISMGCSHPEKHSWKYLDLALAHALLTHQADPIKTGCLKPDCIGFLIGFLRRL